jgi:serine/threonine protein kinase/tetratricopeptide (TPR) repeat protein
MPTSDPYWRGKELFLAALEKSSADRDAFLRGACAADPPLLDEISEMLAAHDRTSGGVMTHPTYDDASAPHRAEAPPGERAGDVIGSYKLLQQIGEGGMGTVFMAEQTHPVARKVALKIIKLGMDSRQVVARFAAEQHALALMEHPNIARVLDAGTTNAGRPFFVMELVKGVSITKYCDEQRLTLRQRLELFIPVCQAVQHAHQKGVIHRDIKPSNVLIALYDGKPVPKVIDFGVAKATGAKLTERTLFTEFGQMLGTVEYMSPEQAGLNQLDIDTRSDIYSLGVLLYELLTGTTPLEHKRVISVALLDILRLVREEETPRPSTRLSTTEQLPSIAANRGMEPKKLNGLVRGELDWIVMKALEKDRSRRYETANGLARDLERHLRDEAVEACPPSAAYRFQKFARRHKGGLAVGLALAAALLLAVAGLVVNNRLVTREKNQKEAALAHALQEKQRADQNLVRARKAVNDFLTLAANNQLLKEANFHELRRDLLASAIPFYQEFVEQKKDDPELEAERGRAYGDLALVREQLGETDQALIAHEQRRDIFEKLATGPSSQPAYRQELANSYRGVGTAYYDANQPAKAEPAMRRAATILEALTSQYSSMAPYRQDLAGTYNNLGILLRGIGREGEALDVQQKAVAIRERLVSEFGAEYRRDLAESLSNLSSVFNSLGQHENALASNKRAADLLEKLAHEHPRSPLDQEMWGGSLDNQSYLLCELGRSDEGLAALQQALRIIEKLAADFPSVPGYRHGLATSLMNLSILQAEMGRHEDGLATCDRAIRILEALVSESPKVVAYQQMLAETYHSQSDLHRRSNRLEQALASSRKALGIQEKLVADNPTILRLRQDLARTHHATGEFLSQLGHYEESAAALEKALSIREELVRTSPADPENAANLAGTYGVIGNLQLEQHKPQVALEWYDKALAKLTPVLADTPQLVEPRRFAGKILMNRAIALGELARHADALKDLEQALALDPVDDRIALRLQRATTMAHLHMQPQATAEAAAVAEIPDLSAGQFQQAAGVFAICSAEVRDDPALSERYAARAVALLGRAFEKDYCAVAENVTKDAALDVLRSREDFLKLSKEWQAKQP